LSSLARRFDADLVRSFRAVAGDRLRALDAKFTANDREEPSRPHPVWPDGRPLLARPSDTRLTSIDPEARSAARIAFRQVLGLYAHARVDRDALSAMAEKIEALRFNESV
jgi:hypothetical protein